MTPGHDAAHWMINVVAAATEAGATLFSGDNTSTWFRRRHDHARTLFRRHQ